MKKIFSILLTALAVSALAPAASGQEQDWSIKGQIKDPKYPGQEGHIIDFPKDTGPTVDKKKNFGYSKNVSSPFSDGTYWIKLESFATGSAKVEDKPSDIVLVLDVSGSMNDTYKAQSTGATAYVPYADNTYQQINNQPGRYIEYRGEYRKVQLMRLKNSSGNNVAFNQGGYAWAYFQVGSETYYLDGFGTSEQIRLASDPTDMSDHPVYTGSGNFGNNTVMWRGTLYDYDTNGLRKIEALKEAVVAFIKEIQDNDMYITKDGVKMRRVDDEGHETTLGNRVSVVKFAHSNYYRTNHLTEGNHKGASNDDRYNYTELVKNYTYVDDEGVADLIHAIASLSEGGHTAADYGMTIANEVLAQPQPSSGRISNKTVVMFTDGDPNHGSGFNSGVANTTINLANTSKTTYKATVFGVAIFPSANTDRTTYMNRVSSNYENATSMTNTGARHVSDLYYIDAANGNLKDVFLAIARMSGGSDATLSAASSNVDIVSHSFKFPDDVTADNIGTKVKIFTAKLDHIENLGEENEKYVFDTEILAGHSNDKYKTFNAAGEETGEYFVDEHSGQGTHGQGLKAEMVTTPDGNKGVRVTNFDYANNWCGPVVDQAGDVTYQGHEIIILIPIQMNPDAVGGPNVQTNTDGSGIFINENESYIDFKSPTVSLPVNIYIEKTGIEGVESAKFLVERASLPALPEGQDEYTLQDIQGIPEANWKYVTTVFVTNSDNAQHDAVSGNPVVRVKGLPASETVGGVQKGLVYRISEETWSWAYKPVGAKYQYTVTGQVNNPFTFENETENTAVKHAESKVTNIFKSGTTKVFDDSKDNGR